MREQREGEKRDEDRSEDKNEAPDAPQNQQNTQSHYHLQQFKFFALHSGLSVPWCSMWGEACIVTHIAGSNPCTSSLS